MRRALVLAISLSLAAAAPAFAQDDDLPSLPSPNKPKPKPKARPKAQPKKQPAASTDDDLPSLPAQRGDLIVKLATPVKGAKLTIDDRDLGTLPVGPQSLTAGEHTVTVRRLGYAPFSKKVTVSASKASEVSVSLEASQAVLTVSADVAGAQVFINGRLAGTAPLIELEVPPGNLEIQVKKDGFYDGSQTLSAKAGRDYPIEVKLGAPIASSVVATKSDAPVRRDIVPEPTEAPIVGAETQVDSAPVYQKWWFWTAVVVVVAGVAVTSIVVANNSGGPAPLTKRDFPCTANMGMCSGWINEPAAVVPIPLH